MSQASPAFRLFLSYAHENEACKDRLRAHFAPFVRNGVAEIRDDRAIPAGALWRQEIEGTMAATDAVIFFLDENFIAAWAAHKDAHVIAQRGLMRTYLAECVLLAGNLCLDLARMSEAAAQYVTAAQLICDDGYGHRLAELHLLHAQHDPGAPYPGECPGQNTSAT